MGGIAGIWDAARAKRVERINRLQAQHGPDGQAIRLEPGRGAEKWILSNAFEDRLPEEVVWHEKEQFDKGSGTLDLLQPVIDDFAREVDLEAHARNYPQEQLHGHEEAKYHPLLVDNLYHREQLLPTVAHWRG